MTAAVMRRFTAVETVVTAEADVMVGRDEVARRMSDRRGVAGVGAANGMRMMMNTSPRWSWQCARRWRLISLGHGTRLRLC